MTQFSCFNSNTFYNTKTGCLNLLFLAWYYMYQTDHEKETEPSINQTLTEFKRQQNRYLQRNW